MAYKKIIKVLAGRHVEGYRDVTCVKCGQNIPFFVGDIRKPHCDRCCWRYSVSFVGTHLPCTPWEITQYEGH
jgi:hypothetical protein